MAKIQLESNRTFYLTLTSMNPAADRRPFLRRTVHVLSLSELDSGTRQVSLNRKWLRLLRGKQLLHEFLVVQDGA